MVAAYVPFGDQIQNQADGAAFGRRRPVARIARTLAHELGHYLMNDPDHLGGDPDPGWNLMVKEGNGRNRDLNANQVDAARKTINPASPDTLL